MIRSVPSYILVCLFLIGFASSVSGQTATSGAPKPDAPKGQTAPATSSGVMQLKKQVTGDFSYRFISATDKTGAGGVATSPTPLPAAAGTDNVVALAIPSTINVKDSVLEVL